MDIIKQRLYNQKLIGNNFKTAKDLVSWLGGVQAQEYWAAKWALGQRLNKTEKEIEKDFDDGKILRTHVMRPTWHFVAPHDIRWMLALSASRLNRIISYYAGKSGLDDKFFTRSNKEFIKLLKGRKHLKRLELRDRFEKNGIKLKDASAFGFAIFKAETDGIICSGPVVNKKFTYALLEERVPKAKDMNRDESLAELAKRYFQSHGPAQLQDYVWWSGLTTADARRGIELNKNKIKSESIDGKTYWLIPNKDKATQSTDLHLIPIYDEFTIAYKDRRIIFPLKTRNVTAIEAIPFNNAVIIDGYGAGAWRKEIIKDVLHLKFTSYRKLKPEELKALEAEADRYGKFKGMPAILKIK